MSSASRRAPGQTTLTISLDYALLDGIRQLANKTGSSISEVARTKLWELVEKEEDRDGQLYSYHFNIGNSAEGPVGACTRILARSKQGALEIMREALPAILPVKCADPRVEYLNVHFNGERVHIHNIDDQEEADDTEDPS